VISLDKLNEATVCFLWKEEKILLALKTRKIGKGFLNGYGGMLEHGESSEESLVRETYEETGNGFSGGVIVNLEGVEKIAVANFCNVDEVGEESYCVVHFYIARKWSGVIGETPEMIKPPWYDWDRLPYDRMIPTDMFWLPQALSGKRLLVQAKLGPGQKEIIGQVEVREVEHFEIE